MNKSPIIIVVAVVLTAIITYSLTTLNTENSSENNQSHQQQKPLYWVAPMDPNYRRDQPGKSPMGMELMPFYGDDGAADNSPGTISVLPDVVNNLGVRTATVERRPMNTEITTVGYVRYDEDQLVHIHPRVEGWIEKLFVKAAGDPVSKGEPLYSLYSPQLVNAQEELVLALSRSNARLVGAAEERLRALQIDESVLQQLRKTRQIQQTMTFYSPQTGVVDNLNIREGFYVKPGTTLMSVGALDDVWVEAEIFERQSTLVQQGLAVTMTLDYLPGKRWQGIVDYVYPTLDPKTRTARIRLRFSNPDRLLKPNMFAQVVIHSPTQGATLIVPREAVIRTGKQDRVVLALGDGRFKSVAVTLGQVGDAQAEIAGGVEEGDSIVTSAHFLLDSESSKTSDFKRLYYGKPVAESVWVTAKVDAVVAEHRRVKVTHVAIPEWDWPAMTMEFNVADELVMEELPLGKNLQLQIVKLDSASSAPTNNAPIYSIIATRALETDND